MTTRSPQLLIRDIASNRPLMVTRWWGFRPDTWGAVMFSEQAIVDRWSRDCPGGGFVLGFASHHTQEQIDPKDQGRILGVYEFTPEKILAKDPDALDPIWLTDKRLLSNAGKFRWPFGLKANRAWRFVKSNVMTRETLPHARSRGFILTRDMAPIAETDLRLLNQYLLEEVPVYKRLFEPLRLTEPYATPNRNYLMVCEDIATLCRLPEWRVGEILYKPGISADIDDRLVGQNTHPIARLFGLALTTIWQADAASEQVAREREQRMIAVGERLCRLAASGQREFFLGPRSALTEFISAAGGVRGVR